MFASRGTLLNQVNFWNQTAMKPYGRAMSWLPILPATVLSIALSAQSVAPRHFAQQLSDPLIRSGDEHYYSLEYDKALHDYEKFADKHRDDCFAQNQVLKTVIFRELYRLNLLDTTLYAKEGFLSHSNPEPAEPKVRDRIEEIYQRTLHLENTVLDAHPDDVEALFCRGATRSLKSTFIALVDKSYTSALRNAIGARHDHERVLQLDPAFTDAKTIVATHLYVVGSLPLPIKMLAGVTGISGNKRKGLEYLREVSDSRSAGSVDARVIYAFFLRREAQYPLALSIVRELEAEHPRNYLFALEEANLEKDIGDGKAAAASYSALLANKERYSDAHPELAAFGLGEVLRGLRDYGGAVHAYDSIADMKNVQPSLLARALLSAGEMYDQLGNRDMAMKRYRQVLDSQNTGPSATLAQKHMHRPFASQEGTS